MSRSRTAIKPPVNPVFRPCATKEKFHVSGSEDFEDIDDLELSDGEEEYFKDDDSVDEELADEDENEDEDEVEEDDEGEEDGDLSAGEEEGGVQSDNNKDDEMEELEKEYMHLRHQEQDILKNLKQNKDEDLLKGQAVKNQRALWDKSLELRFLLQKAFSHSNRLPKEPIKSSFCELDKGVEVAYSDLITSSKNTLSSILELQEALLENNKYIVEAADGHPGGSAKHSESSKTLDLQNENEEDWSRVAQMHQRIAPFRDKSIDKWHRKTQVTTGAAAIKGKLQAFNQNISEQVAAYMRDPSRMVKQMQMRRSTVAIIGTVVDEGVVESKGEEAAGEADPELLNDSEFYQQLLKEFFETFDPNSSETAYYALKKMQTKKRKIVDRRASKSRKIRYTIHEKIVNFIPALPPDLHHATPMLVNNIFGLKHHKPTTTTTAAAAAPL